MNIKGNTSREIPSNLSGEGRAELIGIVVVVEINRIRRNIHSRVIALQGGVERKIGERLVLVLLAGVRNRVGKTEFELAEGLDDADAVLREAAADEEQAGQGKGA